MVFVINDHNDSDESNEDGDSRISDEDFDENVKEGKITEIIAGISGNSEHEVVMIDKADSQDKLDSHDKLQDFETIV